MNLFILIWVTGGLPIAAIALGMLLERIRPAQTIQPADIAFDAIYGACHIAIGAALIPVAASVADFIIRSTGGGLIALPTDGATVIVSFAIYMLARDFLEYAFHRAQHAMPVLWAMHSLHHSEPCYNVLTTLRHFWAESALKVFLLYPAIAVAFDVPADFVAVGGVLYFFNHFCAHLNTTASLGRFSTWIMNPQYHRIHHSLEPRHFDKNFADLLPIWDMLFGTVHRPERAEFPDTGLLSVRAPIRLSQALAWPFVRRAPY